VKTRRRRKNARRRRKNPSLGDVNTTVELVVAGAVVFGLFYFGSEIFGFLGNILKSAAAPFQAIGSGVVSVAQFESPSQTANTDATGNAITDSLAVGAAGGG
jgi:hypothetical protein